jgi:hypothetical protein
MRRAITSGSGSSLVSKWQAYLVLAIAIVPLGTYALSRKPMAQRLGRRECEPTMMR